MKGIWIIALAVVTLIAFPISMGNNGAAQIAVVVFFAGSVVLYFLPTIVARQRGHLNTTSITVLNVLLGWTLLGWVAALVWAYSASGKAPSASSSSTGPAQLSDANPRISESSGTKKCPFCAEPVKVEAIKCKHCGSSLVDSQSAK